MRLVNTKAHALLDYALGIILFLSPWLFDFSSRSEAAWMARLSGGLAVTLALITQFEFSIVKALPLKWHLRVDFLSGVVLASSPFLMDFREEVFKPHLVFGLTQMVVAAITDRVLYQTFKETVEREEHPEVRQTSGGRLSGQAGGKSEPKKRKNYY